MMSKVLLFLLIIYSIIVGIFPSPVNKNRPMLEKEKKDILQIDRFYKLLPNDPDKIQPPSRNQGANIFRYVPNRWPTEGKITSVFGMRKHPIYGWVQFHRGVDIANLKSTDIVATADGIVQFAGKKSGYGNMILIDHEIGYETLYGHADQILVEDGDFVRRGTLIARMGSTGVSTGNHLHYEVHFGGEVVDPFLFVN